MRPVVVCGLFCLLFMGPFASAKEEPRVDIRWRAKGGYIDHRSVCYNYPRLSLMQRRCKRQAKQLFRDKCEYYSARVEEVASPYRRRYQREKRRFCFSARQYNPL